jgi:hypothetical protein
MSFLMQVFVWNSSSWEKRIGRFFQMPGGKIPTSSSDTHIQFHKDQIHFLAIHKTHLGIYEARELICVKQVSVLFLSLIINRSLLIGHCYFREK